MSSIRRITVIGAGLMGHAIALDFALHGSSVRVFDSSAERLGELRERARQTAAPLISAHLLKQAELEEALAQLEPTDDLGAACADAEYLAEAVTEDLAL